MILATNVRITLTADERDALATVLDGKHTKRLATRADITELANKLVGGFVEDCNYKAGKVIPAEKVVPLTSDLYRIRDGEAAMLKGKSREYVRGWNLARTDGR